MIKPTVLWNFAKSCSDPMYIGRIMCALGGHPPADLDEKERVMLTMIENDSEWHDENCEKKAQALRAWRARKAAEAEGEAKDLNGTAPQKSRRTHGKCPSCHSSPPDGKSPVPTPETAAQANLAANAPVLGPEEVGQPVGSEVSAQRDAPLVTRERVHKEFERLRNSVARDGDLHSPEGEAAFWEYLNVVDCRKGSGNSDARITDGNVRSTLTSWLSVRRKERDERLRREREAEAKAEAERERAERISNRIMRDHGCYDE